MHLATIQLPPSVQYGKDSVCKINHNHTHTGLFSCTCQHNNLFMLAKSCPHHEVSQVLTSSPSIDSEKSSSRTRDCCKRFQATTVKQYTTHKPSYTCTIYARSINEPHSKKIGLHVMQSHPLHRGDRDCYVSHAQNAVR